MNSSQQFDVAIVGAGAVGGSLAYGLAQAGFKVALIEKTAVSAEQQPAFDERHLGFSRSTQIALQGLGLWSGMAEQAVAIDRIHVSSQGRFGSVTMDAADENLEALGYVLPAREIGRAIHEAIAEHENIQVIAPVEVTTVEHDDETVRLSLQQDDKNITVEASLLIGSDGAQSQIRAMHGIETSEKQYEQSAIIANLDANDIEPGLAYERFIEQGAIALLPRSEQGYAVVCSVNDELAEGLMAMDDVAFGQFITDSFNGRLKPFEKVGKRHRFPLALVQAREVIQPNMTLVGNAAHFIHPVAAQGFNLSMRDVSALIEVLIEARQNNEPIGELSVLQRYADWRKQDERIMVAFTDGLIRLFTNPLLPAAVLRQKGLMALRYLPPVRKLFTRAVTGRLGKQAKLVRGHGIESMGES